VDLREKVALITGGTQGIGAATALALAERGADIAIVARHIDHGVRVKVEALGRRCVVIGRDMALPENATACVQEAVRALGRVDVLVHSAGARAPGGLMEVTTEVWHEAFDVHVHAILHLCRAAVPLMKQKGGGAIVLVSSVAGLRGCPGGLAYGVVKGAIPQFARLLARELADENIRVNCVAPGIIRTAFQDYLSPAQAKNNIDNRIPLHREGKPEDVAEAIALLATNEFITGECITLDGGQTMRLA